MNYPLAVGIFVMCMAQLSFAQNETVEPMNGTSAQDETVKPMNGTSAQDETVEPMNGTSAQDTTSDDEDSGSIGCPVFQCSFDCPFGLEQDANNCSICKCIDPCQKTVCPDFTKCQFDENQCVGKSFCSPGPHCVAIDGTVEPMNGTSDNASTGNICPLYKCQTPCRSGYGVDMNGCLEGCRCIDPCEHVECPDDKMCLPLSYNAATCVDACCPPGLFSAFPQPTKPCDRVSCSTTCEKGKKCCSGNFGCKRCMYPIPCQRLPF